MKPIKTYLVDFGSQDNKIRQISIGHVVYRKRIYFPEQKGPMIWNGYNNETHHLTRIK
jgi:hypothetical protein